MSLKRGLSVMAAVALLSSSACSGNIQEGEIAEQETTPKPAVSTAPVEITFYSSSKEPLFVEDVRKKFPEYTIKYIQKGTGFTFPEMIAGNQTFDIYVESARTYARDLVGAKLEMDLTDLTKKEKLDLNRFDKNGLDVMRSAGGLYGLPIFGSSMVIYYNKEIFDRFGVPYPKDGMTWDEIYEIAKKLTRIDDKPYYGYWLKTKSYLRKTQYSLPFVDLKTEKSLINNEKWKKTIETVYERFARIQGMEGKFEAGWPGSDVFYKNKDVAMYLTDSDMHQGVKELDQMKWDMVSVPSFSDAPGIGTQIMYTYLGIPSFSNHKDESMKIIQYLTSDEYQLSLSKQGFLTALNKPEIQQAIGQDTKDKDKNLKAIYYNKAAPSGSITKYDEYVIEDGIDNVALRELINNKTDLNTMIRKAEELANQSILKNKN
ncbi:ABC transporter substrate-binding protein [Paenibacillus sp. UNC451MF]|uniref:ABC transporter substrate-binding protein n=1 Tax=Paenibacillus sp. UNC451MF TaxID=1449063 RepID=UPI00048FDEC8|nr:extracellular solute-binding protein [Paenibacillus sp. UNC451MF]